MTGTTSEPTIVPTGPLLAWLQAYGLVDLWNQANGLPTPRADFYRRELLRLFVVETRRASRSTARMRFKDRL